MGTYLYTIDILLFAFKEDKMSYYYAEVYILPGLNTLLPDVHYLPFSPWHPPLQ